MQDIKKQIISMARNCPKNRYVSSTQADVIFLKEQTGMTDLELCHLLGKMNYDGLINEFNVQYSGNGNIYIYWFK